MFYWFARWLCRLVLACVRRWDVKGAEHVPANGPVIVTANHISYWDPVVVGCALPRKVHFMAKAELFRFPGSSTFLGALGAFPVQRQRLDRKALRRAQQELSQGHMLGVFPEGARSKTDTMLKPHLGAALLAIKNNTPVLPIGLNGTNGLFGKVRVQIGKPLVFGTEEGEKPTKERLETVAQDIMQAIGRLIKV